MASTCGGVGLHVNLSATDPGVRMSQTLHTSRPPRARVSVSQSLPRPYSYYANMRAYTGVEYAGHRAPELQSHVVTVVTACQVSGSVGAQSA